MSRPLHDLRDRKLYCSGKKIKANHPLTIDMMETMYTRLGTSQQPKLLSTSNDRLFVVTRKPLTPLPTIAADPGTTGRDGDQLARASSRKGDGVKFADTHLSFEMGKRVKKNGTTATTVKVVFPDNRGEGIRPGHSAGDELRNSGHKTPAVRRANIRQRESLEGMKGAEIEQDNGDSPWNPESFSQVRTMGGKRERELEDNHSNCMHPHVTRVDILFKPLANTEATGEEDKPKTRPKMKQLVSRQLTKQTPFGSKESIQSVSTSDILVKPNKPDPYGERDELSESTESTSAEGAWDSAAYTAKNTRIEFARTLHVPRPFVLRKDRRWSKRKGQEKTRICSRHLQHTRPVPRRLPSPHYTVCPDQLRVPWLVTPTQRRFQPARPLALTSRASNPKYSRDISKFRHNGMIIGPSHPHLHLAAINSVYNCNRLSLASGTDTPPASEADSLEYLDDFEAFNLKTKMDYLIDKFKNSAHIKI